MRLKKQIITSGLEYLKDNDIDQYILVEDYLKYNLNCENFYVIGEVYDAKSYSDAQDYLDKIIYKCIEIWSKSIKRIYDIELTRRQSEMIMYPFLRMELFDLYYRYRKLSSVEINNEDYVYINSVKEYKVERYAADSMRNIYMSDEKQAFIWAFVAKSLGIRVNYLDNSSFHNEIMVSHIKRLGNIFKRIITRPHLVIDYSKRLYDSKNTYIKKPNKNTKVILLDSLLGEKIESEFEKQSKKTILSYSCKPFKTRNRKIIEKYEKDFDLRNTFWECNEDFYDDFLEMVIEYLKNVTPLGYVEAFGELYYDAYYQSQDIDVKKIYGAYSSIEYIDIYEAVLSKKGTKICEIQHSAAYPYGKYKFVYELVHGDVFCTWGWDADEDIIDKYNCEVKKVAMSRLPKRPENNNIQRKGKILLAVNMLSKGEHGEGWNYSNYISRQIQFISKLSYIVRCKLVIRIDTNEKYNMILAKHCKENFPEVRIESRYEKSFSDSLSESELLICDYYGSPHIEAQMLGRKWMMFEASTSYLNMNCLDEFIDKFKKAGIYYEEPEDLAKMLNETRDIEQYLEKYQGLYDEYLSMFANNDEDIYEKWYAEFVS